jgi:tetratricopeptide (TPR) repeat protein
VSLFAFLGALLTKESATTLPLVILFLMLFLYRGSSKKRLWPTFLKYKWMLIAFALVFIFYLLIRILIFDTPIGASKPVLLDNPLAHAPAVERVLGAAKIQLKYLSLLFLPLNLSADYSYNEIALQGISHLITGGIGLIILALLIFLLIPLYKKGHDLFLPLSFYLATIIIISNFFLLIGTIMAERLLYIPSAAFCIFLGLLFSPDRKYLLRGKKSYTYFCILLALLVLLGGAKTFSRNKDWKDEKSLYRKTILTSPMSAKMHNNLGDLYLDEGDLMRAEKELTTALRIYPDYSTANCNYGALMERKGRLNDAFEAYQKAIELNPKYALAYFNLGNALQKKDEFQKAIIAYRQAISIDPHFANAFYNLANTFALAGKYDAAASHYRRVLDINSDYTEAANNLGLVLKELGKRREAEMAFQKAISISPSYHASLFNLGKLYAENGNYQKAILLLERARKENKSHFGTLLFLGLSYHQSGEFKKSYTALKKAQEIQPGNEDLKAILSNLDKKK